MTKELIMMIGIPGSGKTTWIKNTINELEYDGAIHCACISRDAIRFSMLKDGMTYFTNEQAVFKEYIRQLNEAMELGFDYVFADATHLTEKSRKRVLSHLKPDSRSLLRFCSVSSSLDTALQRNAQRTGLEFVPEETIRSMSQSMTSPEFDSFPDDRYGFAGIIFTEVYPRGNG